MLQTYLKGVLTRANHVFLKDKCTLLRTSLSQKNASFYSFQTDLVIFDGTNRNSKEIGKIFGKRHPDLLKSISSTGSSLLIAFNTFKVLNFDLDHLIIKASIKYNKIDSNCQKWLNYASKFLLSPNYPNEYNNNIKCTWLISAKFGSYLELAFKFIEVNQPTIIELCLIRRKVFFTNK